MSNPLTWRTLAGPQYDPNQTFQNAISNINQLGFGSLNKALTGYQQQEGELFTEDKAKNQQAAIEALRQYKTPEELQAAIASGAVNQLLDPMGNRVDRSKVINYADARVKDLRTDITAEQTFKSLQEKQAAAPVLDAVKAAYTKGDVDTANKLILSNAGLLKNYQSDLASFANEAEKGKYSLERARNENKISTATFDNELKAKILNGEMTVKEAEEKKKLFDQNREAEDLTQQFTNDFKKQEAVKLGQIKNLTKAFGLVTDPKTGLADYAKSDPEAVVAYAKELKNQKLDGSSTTEAYNTARDSFSKFHPDIQKKALTQLGTALDPEPVLSPKDQANLDNRLANLVAKVDSTKKTNFLYQDPATATDELTSLLSQAQKDMTKEDMNTLDIRANLASLANKGMELKIDGQTVVVPLTVKLIKQAYEAGKDPDTFWTPNQTEKRVREHLETVMANPANRKLFLEAEDLRNEKYKVDARAIKDSFYGISGRVSASAEAARANEFADEFSKKLYKEKEAAVNKKTAESQEQINDNLRKELKIRAKKVEDGIGFRIRPGM